jgi:hypothetical protein
MFAAAQGDVDYNSTFGKTEEEILAMGEDKWNAFYSSKAGDSTAAMVGMNGIYGEALLHRNEKLAKKASPAAQTRVEKLRKLMDDFGGEAVGLGSNFTGGGTIWSPISAEIETDSETVIYAILGGESKKPKHEVVSSVSKQLDALKAMIMKDKADKDDQAYFKFGDAKVSLNKLHEDFTQILAVAQLLDRTNSDRVLGFCLQYAILAKGDFS